MDTKEIARNYNNRFRKHPSSELSTKDEQTFIDVMSWVEKAFGFIAATRPRVDGYAHVNFGTYQAVVMGEHKVLGKQRVIAVQPDTKLTL